MNQPNTDLLNDLMHSPEWDALKAEIIVFRDNSLFRLKRENEVNREYQAGMVSAFEDILALEDKYKNTPKVNNESNN